MEEGIEGWKGTWNRADACDKKGTIHVGSLHSDWKMTDWSKSVPNSATHHCGKRVSHPTDRGEWVRSCVDIFCTSSFRRVPLKHYVLQTSSQVVSTPGQFACNHCHR